MPPLIRVILYQADGLSSRPPCQISLPSTKFPYFPTLLHCCTTASQGAFSQRLCFSSQGSKTSRKSVAVDSVWLGRAVTQNNLVDICMSQRFISPKRSRGVAHVRNLKISICNAHPADLASSIDNLTHNKTISNDAQRPLRPSRRSLPVIRQQRC